MSKPRVFIGCSVAAKPVAEHAADALRHDAEPEVWTDNKFFSVETPIENLFRFLDDYDFALFITLPQDATTKGDNRYLSVRDNVLFEIGLFLGRLGRKRVFLIAPQDGGTLSLRLPSDLTGIAPNTYDPGAASLQSQVSISLNEMKRAVREFVASKVIFDSGLKVTDDTLISKGGRRYEGSGKPVNDDVGQAVSRLTYEALEIRRTGKEGVWEVEVRPNGRRRPSLARVDRPGRTVKVAFEAKVSDAEHKVICVSIDADNWQWLENEVFVIRDTAWKAFNVILSAPEDRNVLIRIQDEVEVTPSGTLYLRNISVRPHQA